MRLFISTIFLFLTFGAYAQEIDTTFIWPTNASPYLSSTFGETRSAHFHAGLDIKTWGREGYKVYATRDAILSRLLITNQGYGKAVYLKHADNSYTVYAHMQRFNEQLQAISDSLRMEYFTYEMDAFMENDSIMVKKGDIIGYTGSTGVGPPHLHYEIRDADNNPVNPLRSNLEVEDDLPPIFSALMIEPLNYETIIDGKRGPGVYRAISQDSSVYDFGTIPVNGTIGISANVYDMANNVTNKYAAYELLLIAAGDTLYQEQINQFTFGQADNMFINRVAAPQSTRRSFQRLFLKDGNTHPFVLKYQKKTTGHFHKIYTLIAKDYYGNQATATITFSPSPQREFKKSADLITASDFQQAYWNEDWVVLNDSLVVDLRSPETNMVLGAESLITRLIPETNAHFWTPDYRLRTRFNKGSFFDSLSILQSYSVTDSAISLNLWGATLPIRKNYEIQFYLGDLASDSALFRLYEYDTDRNKLSYIDSEIRGKTLIAYPSAFGSFRILSDTLNPEIEQPELITMGNGLSSYRIRTHDDLSGIDYKSGVFIINNQQGIAEYDFENDEFIYYHPGYVPMSGDEIYFEVKDKAGNKATASFRL